MNQRNFGIFAIIAILFVSSAQAETPPPGGWSKTMQELQKSLATLLTDVTSDRRFGEKKNFPRIQKEAEKLAKLSHGMNRKGEAPDSDPTLAMFADLMKQESTSAVKALKRGDRAYAREILRTIPSYCIACHTRNSTGPQFDHLPLSPSISSLTPLERGEFFAATRQFDLASKEFQKIVFDRKLALNDPWSWRKAVHQALAITVRVKKSPEKSAEIVDAILKTEEAPMSMRLDAKVWKQSLNDWAAEKSSVPSTQSGLRAEAIRLFAKAKGNQQYPIDRAADIDYLRASAATHDLLQVAKDDATAADALLLAGLGYEVLEPLRRDNVNQMYYEACIRRSPHSEIAEQCFRRLESSATFGYTGSAGTDVPDEITDKLSKLRGLAKPKPMAPLKPM